jgi:hypothetical protein
MFQRGIYWRAISLICAFVWGGCGSSSVYSMKQNKKK